MLKETTNKFSSKLIVNELVILASATSSTEAPTITTTSHEKNISKLPLSLEERIGKLVSTAKLKQKILNLRIQLKIQRFIHQQHQHQMSNLNKSSRTGSTLHRAPTIMRPSWPHYWPCFYSSLVSNHQKRLCLDNFHGPTHHIQRKTIMYRRLFRKCAGEKTSPSQDYV